MSNSSVVLFVIVVLINVVVVIVVVIAESWCEAEEKVLPREHEDEDTGGGRISGHSGYNSGYSSDTAIILRGVISDW